MSLRLAWTLSGIVSAFFLFLAAILLLEGGPALYQAELLRPGYWDFRSESFRALSMVFGSLVVASLSVLVALPLALGAAIYISEFAKGKTRYLLKVAIELLAGIPSVVYGLLGIAFVLPWIAPYIMAMGGMTGDSLLAATILLSIMVLPTLITFSDDALRCVSKAMREEGLSLGLSRLQVIFKIVIPYAKKGLLATLMLAYGRAIGETIAIFMVIGRMDLPFGKETLTLQSLISAGQTLTTKLGGAELSIAYGDQSHWQAMMGLGLILWLLVITFSWVGTRLIRMDGEH